MRLKLPLYWNVGILCVRLLFLGVSIYCNTLVAMRPATMKKEMPSAHEVSTYIHNKFVEWLKDTKKAVLNTPPHVLPESAGLTGIQRT